MWVAQARCSPAGVLSGQVVPELIACVRVGGLLGSTPDRQQRVSEPLGLDAMRRVEVVTPLEHYQLEVGPHR